MAKPKAGTSSKGRVQVDGKTVNVKLKSRNPIIEFDDLQIYMALPHTIDIEGTEGEITIYSPTMGQVIQMGIDKFNIGVSPFIANTTMYRLPLWEMGIDWNDFPDFDLFCMLIKTGVDKEVSNLLFGEGFDWSKFELYSKQSEDGASKHILYNQEDKIEINEVVYFHLSQYIRKVLMRSPDEKITKDPSLKHEYIMKDKRHQANEEWKKEHDEDSQDISLQSLISACLNHPGFKYKRKELMDVGINEFYDSVARLQVYESSVASLHGAMGGMIDAKKLPKDSTNFMRKISD